MINAVSKNKITHLLEPNSKRTICNLNTGKRGWNFYGVKVDNPKCEKCREVIKYKIISIYLEEMQEIS